MAGRLDPFFVPLLVGATCQAAGEGALTLPGGIAPEKAQVAPNARKAAALKQTIDAWVPARAKGRKTGVKRIPAW